MIANAENTGRPEVPYLKQVTKSPNGISLSWEKVLGADGYSSGNVVNTLPFNLFNLRRYRVGSTHTPNFTELQGYIDEIASTNGWAIWMMHSHNDYMNDDYINALKQAIEYCDTVKVKIISVEEALELFNID